MPSRNSGRVVTRPERTRSDSDGAFPAGIIQVIPEAPVMGCHREHPEPPPGGATRPADPSESSTPGQCQEPGLLQQGLCCGPARPRGRRRGAYGLSLQPSSGATDHRLQTQSPGAEPAPVNRWARYAAPNPPWPRNFSMRYSRPRIAYCTMSPGRSLSTGACVAFMVTVGWVERDTHDSIRFQPAEVWLLLQASSALTTSAFSTPVRRMSRPWYR